MYCDHKSWLQKGFIWFHDWWIQLRRFGNPDLQVQSLKIWFVDLFRRLIFKRFNLFSWIQQILTNPDESLVHRRTLNKPESIQILGFGFVNPYCFQKIGFVDSFRGFILSYCVQKIRFVDSICRPVFERFVLWICFVKTKIPNYSIHFVSEGFIYDSRILSIYRWNHQASWT